MPITNLNRSIEGINGIAEGSEMKPEDAINENTEVKALVLKSESPSVCTLVREISIRVRRKLEEGRSKEVRVPVKTSKDGKILPPT